MSPKKTLIKKIYIQILPLIMLLLFTVIYTLEFIYVYCICMVQTPYNGVPLCISFHICIQWCQVGSLKLAMVKVLTSRKRPNAICKSRLLSQMNWLSNIYQHTDSYYSDCYNKSSLIYFLFTGKKEWVAIQNVSYL